MPLSINVGLSRKASKNYQSNGVSINIVAELDAALLARPEELQQQIDGLYQQAQNAIDRNTTTPEPRRSVNGRNYSDRNDRHRGDDYGQANGNGQTRRNGNGAMTESQRRAILAIARRCNADVDYEAREIIGADFDDLTLRQASELIDHLKTMQPMGNGRNGRS